MDDGRLTDSQGRTVNFSNTIIIMTSNLGSELISKSKKTVGFIEENAENYKDIKEQVMSSVKKAFRPEFINRLDDTIVFKPLSMEDMKAIVDIMVGRLEERLIEKKLTIKVSDAAKKELAEKGFDPVFGARPLRRVIERDIETPLANKIIMAEIQENDEVLVELENNQLVVKKGKSKNKKKGTEDGSKAKVKETEDQKSE
jgi:ATP-dependent Clp protease ATP-binding subunit ClpC